MEDLRLSISVRTASKIANDLHKYARDLSAMEQWLGSRMDWNEAHSLRNVRQYITAISQRFATQVQELRDTLVAEGIRNRKGGDAVENK